MNTYFFKVEVEPLPGNEQGESVESALANLWIRAETMEHAEEGAFAIISAYGWAPLQVATKHQIQPQQLPYQDTQAQSAYLRAQEHGAALLFVGWSKPGHTGDGEAHPLLRPPKNLLQ